MVRMAVAEQPAKKFGKRILRERDVRRRGRQQGAKNERHNLACGLRAYEHARIIARPGRLGILLAILDLNCWAKALTCDIVLASIALTEQNLETRDAAP